MNTDVLDQVIDTLNANIKAAVAMAEKPQDNPYVLKLRDVLKGLDDEAFYNNIDQSDMKLVRRLGAYCKILELNISNELYKLCKFKYTNEVYTLYNEICSVPVPVIKLNMPESFFKQFTQEEAEYIKANMFGTMDGNKIVIENGLYRWALILDLEILKEELTSMEFEVSSTKTWHLRNKSNGDVA